MMPENQTVQFSHVRLYAVTGVHLRDEEHRQLLACSDERAEVYLTTKPGDLCQDAYVVQASSRLLIGAFAGVPQHGSFEARLQEQTEALKSDIERKGSTFLLIRRTGSIKEWESRSENEIEGYILRLNGSPAKSIRTQSAELYSSVVTALFVASAEDVSLVRLLDEVAFQKDNGTVILAKTIEGSGSISVSTELTKFQEQTFLDCWKAIYSDETVSRVQKLLVAAIETRKDPLRAFMSASAGLEIFVNKVFPDLEQSLFDTVQTELIPSGHTGYIQRIKAVMSDKYRLADKFSLISSLLAPESVDEDIVLFRSVKAARDEVAHGRAARDTDLPVHKAVSLLKKYLQLYVNYKSTPGSN
ncbi:hypothetical protein [Chromohalobacter israelensis]|uniref:hypothetical protein n=1 Tax=Chromohalobacter israelensis TaxID=141390 RepID=UPI0011B29101|nr:hypothetical protein [Chromohalobacter salexigens]